VLNPWCVRLACVGVYVLSPGPLKNARVLSAEEGSAPGKGASGDVLGVPKTDEAIPTLTSPPGGVASLRIHGPDQRAGSPPGIAFRRTRCWPGSRGRRDRPSGHQLEAVVSMGAEVSRYILAFSGDLGPTPGDLSVTTWWFRVHESQCVRSFHFRQSAADERAPAKPAIESDLSTIGGPRESQRWSANSLLVDSRRASQGGTLLT
jgi:hypothetical protein